MTQSIISDQLLTLLQDYKDFNSSPIDVQTVPSPVEFSKQVSRGYPCVYRAYDKTIDKSGKVHTWTDPSIPKCSAFTWTRNDLSGLVGDKCEVAITPNGKADDLHKVAGREELVFLAPATIQMTVTELLDRLSSVQANQGNICTRPDPVFYLQSQNSNLTTTSLAPILKHAPQNFAFAEGVLGSPEAINIWIGDQRSVTSTHRDPYENLYLVLRGSKNFILYPPVDEIVLPTQTVMTGNYEYDSSSGMFSTKINHIGDEGRIPWVCIDPLEPRESLIARYPMYMHSTPRVVTVHEGEILYLPSGWFHHVQQRCGIWDEDGTRAPCIAINYWYDMDYEGEKYVMRQLVSRLASKLKKEASQGGGQSAAEK